MRRTAAALVLEGFTSRLAFGLLSFTVPLYAHQRGLSLVAIGVLVSTTPAISLLLKPTVGALADRWGVRRSLLAALVVRSLLCLGYLVPGPAWGLFVVRAAHGASDALRDPSVHALIAVHGGERTMASTFAWYQAAKSTAGAVGKGLAGLLLATAFGYPLVFVVAFVLSMLPVAVVAMAVAPTTPTEPAEPAEPAAADPPALVDPALDPAPPRPGPSDGVLPFAVLGFAVAGTSSLLTSLFPVIATEYAGLSTAQAGAVYLVTPALALTGPAWGWLADRVSTRLVLSVRGVANVVSSVVLMVAPSAGGVWAGRALDDLGKAAFRPAWGAVMAEVSGRRPERRARTMGVLTAGEDLGDLAAPLVAGLVWTLWGVPALLVLRAVAALAAELYVVRLERRLRPRDRARSGASGAHVRR